MSYMIKNIQISVISLRFYAFFRLFYSILGVVRTEKYHKIRKNYEKQNDFSTFFLRRQGKKTTSQKVKFPQSSNERRG